MYMIILVAVSGKCHHNICNYSAPQSSFIGTACYVRMHLAKLTQRKAMYQAILAHITEAKLAFGARLGH